MSLKNWSLGNRLVDTKASHLYSVVESRVLDSSFVCYFRQRHTFAVEIKDAGEMRPFNGIFNGPIKQTQPVYQSGIRYVKSLRCLCKRHSFSTVFNPGVFPRIVGLRFSKRPLAIVGFIIAIVTDTVNAMQSA